MLNMKIRETYVANEVKNIYLVKGESLKIIAKKVDMQKKLSEAPMKFGSKMKRTKYIA